jgi:uncharacterized protein YtpQ (UPF0354 family)
MAQLVITYPDEHRDRVIEAMCSKFGYDAEEEALTPDEFVALKITVWIKRIVSSYEQDKAAKEILAEVRSSVAAIDIEIGG